MKKKKLFLVCCVNIFCLIPPASSQTLFTEKTYDLHEYKVDSPLERCLQDIVKLEGGGQWCFTVWKNLKNGCVVEVVATPEINVADRYYGVIKIKNAFFLLREEVILEDTVSNNLFKKHRFTTQIKVNCYEQKQEVNYLSKDFSFSAEIIDYPSRIIYIQEGNVSLSYGNNSYMDNK